MLHGKKDATKKHEIMCSCMGRTRDGGQDEKVQEISGVASEIKNESPATETNADNVGWPLLRAYTA